MLAAALTLLLWHPFPPEFHRGQLEMTAIDVGQGDSILVVFPDGKRMLMDGGGIPAFGGKPRAQLDIGEDVVAPYLWERSFRTVDVVAAIACARRSHRRAARHGQRFPSQGNVDGRNARQPSVGDAARQGGREPTKITPLEAPACFEYGGAEIQVLAPMHDYVPENTPKNNDSLVLRIRYGQRSFLLTGDVERPIEQWMLTENEIQPTDVLKVAHHGSKTSSTEEFLGAVSPLFAVISVGYGNSYGHPNPDVVGRLAQHGTVVMRTDQDGLVTVRTDGRRLFVETNGAQQ